MKLITLFLSLCLSLNVLASSGSIEALEQELDEYQYALTVEWDQKDNAFYEAKTEKFFDSMSALMSSQKITQKEILAMVEAKSKNKKATEALKLKLSLMDKNIPEKELIHTLKDSAKDLYGSGASWIGGIDQEYFLIGLGIAALVGYLVWFDANYRCGGYREEWECTTTSSGSTSTTNCGWKTVCAYYVEK